jgi:hypothetical protein
VPEKFEAAVGLICVSAGDGDPVGQREQVGRGDVSADLAGGLRARQQRGSGRAHGVVPLVEQGRSLAAAIIGNCGRELPFGRHVGDEGAQPGEQRVCGRLAPEQGLTPGAQRRDLVGEDGDDDNIAAGP